MRIPQPSSSYACTSFLFLQIGLRFSLLIDPLHFLALQNNSTTLICHQDKKAHYCLNQRFATFEQGSLLNFFHLSLNKMQCWSSFVHAYCETWCLALNLNSQLKFLKQGHDFLAIFFLDLVIGPSKTCKG